VTAGWVVSISAIRWAFAQCRSIRTASVLIPRRVSQESNGPGTAPVALRVNARPSASSADVVITAPPTTSEWPPRYLVVEWTTTSAPSSSGRCRYGEAKVLSTTRSAPWSCASSARARMSVTFSSGLVGVSAQTIFAGDAASRASTAAASSIGTGS
jgi:hypothetical protein